MKAGFLILICCLALGQCTLSQEKDSVNRTDNAGFKQGHWIKKYANGNIQYDGFFRDNNPYGQFKRYYDTGEIQSILNFSDDGTEADATFFHENGFTASKGKYVNQGGKMAVLFRYSRRLPALRGILCQ